MLDNNEILQVMLHLSKLKLQRSKIMLGSRELWFVLDIVLSSIGRNQYLKNLGELKYKPAKNSRNNLLLMCFTSSAK